MVGGTVYLAQDLKHSRQVAIKVLRPELAASLGTERFLREIQIAAGLHHPHILPLYDSGEADGLLYYVMPFVEGESLRDRMDREKQLPLADALQIRGKVATPSVTPTPRGGQPRYQPGKHHDGGREAGGGRSGRRGRRGGGR